MPSDKETYDLWQESMAEEERKLSEGERPLPEVYKVIGAPGTGKTTRVVGNPELPDVTSLVMENLESYPFNEQYITTYTKAGTTEAADRLEKIIDMPRYQIDNRVSTIHSQCYHALNVDQDQVVSWYHKQEFCKEAGLQYGNDSGDEDIMSGDQDEGHALFDIYGWLKSNRRPLENYDECPIEFPEPRKDVLELMKQWERYKDLEDLIQFSDMIEHVVQKGKQQLMDEGIPWVFPPDDPDAVEVFTRARYNERMANNRDAWRGRGPFIDTKVLYVDEVQDLPPLQWAWYLMQKLVCEKVYIGGDDDQTIYGWAGANPNFMLDEEGDFEVLETTYRIPRNIWETCDGVIQQVDKRQEKQVQPDGDGGEVIPMKAPSTKRVLQYAQEGSVFILFRANYMIQDFTEKMHKEGIPYVNVSAGYETWSDDVVTLRDALAKIDNGADKLGSDEISVLTDYAVRECNNCNGDGCKNCNYDGEESMMASDSGWTDKEQALSGIGGVKMERVEDIIDLSGTYTTGKLTSSNFIQQCSELNYYQKEALKGNLRQNNEDLYPERVRMGTIHSSKGKEAETVILATDSTQTILENMIEDTRESPNKVISDAERRVYYVGMTRASERLILAQGLVNKETSINLSDLLDGEPDTGGEGWQMQDTSIQTSF